jgi:hypothetical protein
VKLWPAKIELDREISGGLLWRRQSTFVSHKKQGLSYQKIIRFHNRYSNPTGACWQFQGFLSNTPSSFSNRQSGNPLYL